jgi:tRNA 2-selenouridine synthase
VARNIARHLEEMFQDRPRGWRPLIYCWRGGQRSGSMAEIFSRIGWKAAQLEGGYRAYKAVGYSNESLTMVQAGIRIEL